MSAFASFRRVIFLDPQHSRQKRIVVTLVVSVGAIACVLAALLWARSEEWFWLVFAAMAMYLCGYWAVQIGHAHIDAPTFLAFMATVVFCGMCVNYVSSITTAGPMNRTLKSIQNAQTEAKKELLDEIGKLNLSMGLIQVAASTQAVTTKEILELQRAQSTANQREREYQQTLAQWRQEVQRLREQHVRALDEYGRQVRDGLVREVAVGQGERGSNFRMDLPRGTTLTFELEPQGVCRLKRDKPHGTDPNIFSEVRDGTKVTTTWDPGCENCNFYLKQDTHKQMTIKIWKGDKPVRPLEPTLPPEPARPS